MNIKKYNIYLADLNPPFGSEPGKIRPVVVVQSDLLNGVHKSTLVCPLTTNIQKAPMLRIFIPARQTSLAKNSDIMVDQVRAIDNKRFIRFIGKLTNTQRQDLEESLRVLILE